MSEMQNQLLKIVKFTKVENGCQEYEKYSDSAERNKRMWLKHPIFLSQDPARKSFPSNVIRVTVFSIIPRMA